MAVSDLQIDLIRIDGGTQARAKIDQDTVADYAARYENNQDMPPLVVFYDGTDHWLGDGFHRYHAARQAGRNEIACDCRKGTQREAILYSCGANSSHGLKRTNADKRKAVSILLADPEWARKSNRWIADIAVVGDHLVAEIRTEMKEVQLRERAVEPKREGRDGKARPAVKPKADPNPETQVQPDPVQSSPEDEGGYEPHESVPLLQKAETSIGQLIRLADDVSRMTGPIGQEFDHWRDGCQRIIDAINAIRKQVKRR